MRVEKYARDSARVIRLLFAVRGVLTCMERTERTLIPQDVNSWTDVTCTNARMTYDMRARVKHGRLTSDIHPSTQILDAHFTMSARRALHRRCGDTVTPPPPRLHHVPTMIL